MSLSLVLCAGHMADYAFKVWLLAAFGRDPGLRAQFVIVAVAHVAANIHNTYLFFRAVPNLPLPVLPLLVVVFGVATPLMQVVHMCDALAAWWVSQDMSGRTPLRAAPLDVVFEGLVFALMALHVRFSLLLGRLDTPQAPSGFDFPLPGSLAQLPFESLLLVSAVTFVAMVASALVMWDASVSLKLSSDMYGWPTKRPGSRGAGTVMSRAASSGRLPLGLLLMRASEVGGKSALLVALAVLLGEGCAARYVASSYVCGFAALLALSPRKEAAASSSPASAAPAAVPTPWPCLASSVVAWPLLFANLPQFIDCPRHSAAAATLAGIVSGFRAIELGAVFSAIVAAVLLEDEVLRRAGRGAAAAYLGPGLGLGLGGAAEEGAPELLRSWRLLYDRNATLVWVFCVLLHYVCVLSRWFLQAVPEQLPHHSEPVAGARSTPGGALARSPGPASWSRSPVVPARGTCRDDRDFWPPASGIAPLLLAASLERAPLAWPLDRATTSTTGALGGDRSGGPADRPLRMDRMEDFDTLRLIGSGEFGKVYQVRHKGTQEVFAMKRLSKEFYSKRRMSDRAIRELATLYLARDHPFVVRLVARIETVWEWALVMEYCPEGDLHQLLLKEGSPGLTLAKTLQLSAEVALALQHLHARGIVFRDLKLENVVLDQDGHAKLTDFGLAKQQRGGRDAIAEAESAGDVYASFTKTFCGSHGYAAPEVNPRRQVHGFAADMYSFGVLLLMMLMGGEVYHDTRGPPWERRLPPDSPSDLRSVLRHLTFEFHWASHHFLAPAGDRHRVEVNLNGAVVLVSRGPRGARQQQRPPAPPNTPRTRSVSPVRSSADPSPEPTGDRLQLQLPPAGIGGAGAGAGAADPAAADTSLAARGSSGGAAGAARASTHGWPVQFPAAARESCEAARRRWDLAIDLVRVLTNEQPEQRGTVARIKQHPFFTEEIYDWRMVYPKSWLLERVQAKLLTLLGRSALPPAWESTLRRLSSEELSSLQDDPAAYVEILEAAVASEASPSAVTEESSRRPSGAAAGLVLSAAVPPGAAPARHAGGALPPLSGDRFQPAWRGRPGGPAAPPGLGAPP